MFAACGRVCGVVWGGVGKCSVVWKRVGDGHVNVGGGGFVVGDDVHDGFGGGAVGVLDVEMW